MEVNYLKTAFWDEKMKSGLFRERIGEIQIHGTPLEPVMAVLNQHFKTNLSGEQYNLSGLDILIWTNSDEPDSFQITLDENYSLEQSHTILAKITEALNKHHEMVKEIKISRDCEIDPARVKDFLVSLYSDDWVESTIRSIPKLCLIDANTYLSDNQIKEMIDQLESQLFEEIVNKKVRVNGKSGILKEVNSFYGRFGFFETGVKKNYVFLSLVQKMGARTIRELVY